jgi:hypothetical protein
VIEPLVQPLLGGDPIPLSEVAFCICGGLIADFWATFTADHSILDWRFHAARHGCAWGIGSAIGACLWQLLHQLTTT